MGTQKQFFKGIEEVDEEGGDEESVQSVEERKRAASPGQQRIMHFTKHG